jgi:competence protein ComGC
MKENLEGMSPEQLMLRDILYEIPDILADADRKTRDYQFGVAAVAKLLESQLHAFEIDQSRFARQMPDIDAWLHGRMK